MPISHVTLNRYHVSDFRPFGSQRSICFGGDYIIIPLHIYEWYCPGAIFLDCDSMISQFILLLVCNRAHYWFTAAGSDTIFYNNDCYKQPDWLFLKSYTFSHQISQILLLFPPESPNPSVCYHVIYSLPVSLEHVNGMNNDEAFRNYKCCHHKISFFI